MIQEKLTKEKIQAIVDDALCQVSGWDLFDGSHGEMGPKEFAKCMEDGDFDDFEEQVWEFIAENSYYTAKELFDQMGYTDFEDKYPNEFEVVKFAVENACNHNWEYLFPSSLLITKEIMDYVDPSWEGEDLEEYYAVCKEHGIAEHDAAQLINQQGYSGMLKLAIECTGQEYAYSDALEGPGYLYIHDAWNGAGGFIPLDRVKIEVDRKNASDQIDRCGGGYSIYEIWGGY